MTIWMPKMTIRRQNSAEMAYMTMLMIRRARGLTWSVTIDKPRCALRRAATAVPMKLIRTNRYVDISSETASELPNT